MTVKKIEAEAEDQLWFYADGWRVGKIVKRYSEDRVTVVDCSGHRRIVRRMENGKWRASSLTERKQEKLIKNREKREKKDVKEIKREKKSGKKRTAVKSTRRIKIEAPRRKVRKIRKITKA